MSFYASDEDDYYYGDATDDACDDILEELTPFASSSSSSASSVKVITRECLLAAQSEDLRKIMSLLSVKEQHARTLLIHHHWDVERVVTVLVERGMDQLCSDAGVIISENEYPGSSRLPSIVSCDICMEEVYPNEVTGMDCGHYFCNTCWTEHFIVKINEGQSKRIRCMAHQCNSICDEAKVRVLVSARDPSLSEKFDRFLLESYIDDNEKVKWCPSVPHCGNALRNDSDDLCEVECTCGRKFCFGCLSEAHSPCSCKMWELWSKKCQEESETINWITVHTKPCPQCRKMVEKNGGCNLVKCICNQAFCWLCGEATGKTHTWSTIEGHSCGRLKDEKKDQTEKAKKFLYEYIHYHSRHKAHADSFKLESKMKETMKQRMAKIEERLHLLRDLSWLTNGLDKLFRSRQILSYTYAFAYYMFGEFGNQMAKKERAMNKVLFEDHQQQLESRVESLSSCLEEPFEDYSEDDFMKRRMQIITLTVLVDQLCGKLYECIENDLLGSFKFSIQRIAPYKSKGVNKASEFAVDDGFFN